MNLNLNVRFETLNEQRAKAYVNDVYVGQAKLWGDRLVFRCSRNPFNNFIPTEDWVLAQDTDVETVINLSNVKPRLISVVIRNYLRNFGYAEAA